MSADVLPTRCTSSAGPQARKRRTDGSRKAVRQPSPPERFSHRPGCVWEKHDKTGPTPEEKKV
ncbi:MAG TPA: hypothetical protein DCW71_06170 [Alistipes sp.]|nr:hypothetical protein [Alistipes sp.]